MSSLAIDIWLICKTYGMDLCPVISLFASCCVYLKSRPVPPVALEALTDLCLIFGQCNLLKPSHPLLFLESPLHLLHFVDLLEPLIIWEGME